MQTFPLSSTEKTFYSKVVKANVARIPVIITVCSGQFLTSCVYMLVCILRFRLVTVVEQEDSILPLHPMTFYQRVVMELEYGSNSAALISLVPTSQ